MKKRFGVSIPIDLYDKIESICNRVGCTRSSIIIEALKNFFENNHHYLKRHFCLGLLIVVKDVNREELISRRSLAKYTKLVSSYNHVHYGRYCIEIFLVIGDSDEITSLHKDVVEYEKPIETRYIPILEVKEHFDQQDRA